MLFLFSGSIMAKYHSTEIQHVRGLLKVAPWTGFAFGCGILALIGLPPFGPFISEFLIFSAGFRQHSAAYAVTGIGLLIIVFAGMLGSVNQMMYGEPPAGIRRGDPLRWVTAPMALNLVLLVALGLFLPAGVRDFLTQILNILGISQ
jgi:hydrogenase-4 component F